jgi:hypothetical protein
MAKFQEIKYTNKGQFVVFHGRRHYLDTFIRFDKSHSFTRGKNKVMAHGAKSMGNSSALVIEISDCGDAAKVMLYINQNTK